MNPNAREWKPSAAAKAWTPSQQWGGSSQPAPSFTVPKPAPAPAPVPAPAPPPAAAAAGGDDDEEIEEDDPLWQAVLKIANGDRSRAKTMIANPDSLMQYPEVAAVLGSGAGDTIVMGTEEVEDWEKTGDAETEAATDQALADATDSKLSVAQKQPAETEAMEEDNAQAPDVDAKEGDPREHLNLVFIGHVDAGKSTLSGNILYLTDNVDKRTIEKYEREAKELNRESWFLAFIMDTDESERAKGKTVEVGRAYFETDVKRYTILDAPGHKNYVPNMIMGASQADVGVLVISARRGEFETGFDRGGQTREHAMLAKTLGVSYLVVVINKMDEPTVQWEKARFDECVTKLRPFLKQCGFVIKKEVRFVPISGLSGANVKEEVDPSVCSWWKKSYQNAENNTSSPTLFALLDSLEIKGRDPTAPVRIPVLERYSDRGTIAMGKVESGTIRPGMKITVMPTRNTYKVEGVWVKEDPVASARPGENILVKVGGANVEDVQKGFVICSDPPCRSVSKIIAQLALMDMPENTRIMTAGFNAMFHCHTCEEECTIVKLFETTNQRGQVNKNPRFANIGMRVICMIELSRTTPVETFEHMPFLGRFTLRTEGKTIAIGKVNKLPPKK